MNDYVTKNAQQNFICSSRKWQDILNFVWKNEQNYNCHNLLYYSQMQLGDTVACIA